MGVVFVVGVRVVSVAIPRANKLAQVLAWKGWTPRGYIHALMALHPTFDQWFRLQLSERKLSHDAAAKVLGVTVQTVRRWAQGKNLPDYRQLMRLREVFGELPQELR